VWMWGHGLEARQIKMPEGCTWVEFGHDILMLNNSGQVLQSNEQFNFVKLPGLSNIKEIAAYDNCYAALDTNNNIYTWTD
jgi:hypothetical protein